MEFDTFVKPQNVAALDDTTIFAPKFNRDGLITAIVIDQKTEEILMVAHMNNTALQLTITTKVAHFWSRSRHKLWRKGETSGEELKVNTILTDCDQDTVALKVTMQGRGAACHTGRRSCFYREVTKLPDESIKLVYLDKPVLFDPKQVYSDPDQI